MSLPLSGQTALVTGGARGIGLATVRALAGLGATVTFTARTAASLASATASLNGIGRGVICDVTDRAALAGITAEGFDILVNNAGVIQPIGRITELSPQAFSASLETNLVAPFDAIRLCLPAMRMRGRGVIVNVSSGAAHRPL